MCRTAPGQRGFTLVELLMVIVIVGILTMIALPSFTEFVERQRVKDAAADIHVALTRARSEALRLSQNVSLSPVSGSTDWSEGWQIADPVTGTTLESHGAVVGLAVTGPASVTYRSSGRTTSTADSLFTIAGNASTLYVCLDLSGRPSITKSTSC